MLNYVFKERVCILKIFVDSAPKEYNIFQDKALGAPISSSVLCPVLLECKCLRQQSFLILSEYVYSI